MNLVAAILRAEEIYAGANQHEYILNADEWIYHMGHGWQGRMPFLQRPVVNMDRDTLEAYVDQWRADFTEREHEPISTTKEYVDTIYKYVLPEIDLAGDYEQPPAKSKAGDKWVSPVRLALTWPNLTSREQRVLLIMAGHGDNNGAGCYIGPTKLAEYLGYADPTSENARKEIKKVRRSLREKGCITLTARHTTQKPGTYRINRGPRVV